MMSTECLAGIPFPALDIGFYRGADFLFSLQEANPAGSNSGSDELNRPAMDDRRRRRMISNRESARRSRMRKQRHLEDTRSLANGLRFEKREIANRLGVVLRHCEIVRQENEGLRSESARLRRRLLDIGRILILRQLQEIAKMNEQNRL